MANRKVLLCLLLAVLTVNLIECKGGRGGSRGGSRGGGSHSSSSRGWGGSHSSSSHGYSKPSWSSGSSGSHSYPSSSSGLSGSSGSGSHGSYYPSSSSGLSGSSGSLKPSYPYSNSGLSGSSSSGYPSSSSGLSGSGSRNTYYPPSQTGLSGSGTSNSWGSGTSNSWGSGTNNGWGSGTSNGWGSGKSNYPPSSNTLSGSGSNSGYPSSGYSGFEFSSGKNYYPSSSSGTNVHTYPSSTYRGANNDNNIYHTLHNTHYNPPTYYSAPQHLYVTEYRNSGSRYSDLLTGLTLYNLGRSHSHYRDHYYNDDYYNRRYNSGYQMYNPYRTYSTPQETATCRLKIKDHDRFETVKIPCEIVSTFKEDSKIVTEKNTVNTTVCVTKTIIVNDTSPSNNVTSIKQELNNNKAIDINSIVSNVALLVQPITKNNTMIPNYTNLVNHTENGTNTPSSTVGSANITTTPSVNITAVTEILPTANKATLPIVKNETTTNATLPVNPEGNKITQTKGTLETKVVNVTTCTTAMNTTDPLNVKGPAVDPSGKECIVEIQTKDSMFHNKIDCSTLLKYAKMPEPKKDDSSLMPSRGTLKTWKSNPPWWMSMFIAV